MMRASLLLGIIILASLSAGAQQPPADLSGRWVADPEPAPTNQAAPPRGDMGSGWGTSFTIAQDAKQLVVEHALFTRYDIQPPLRTVYALDGSETRNALMLGHATQVRTSRASWDGSTLRITTAYPGVDPASGKPFATEVTQRLSLESPSVLVVSVTRAGALGGKETTTRTVYRKN